MKILRNLLGELLVLEIVGDCGMVMLVRELVLRVKWIVENTIKNMQAKELQFIDCYSLVALFFLFVPLKIV
jgi:hypothetical protein